MRLDFKAESRAMCQAFNLAFNTLSVNISVMKSFEALRNAKDERNDFELSWLRRTNVGQEGFCLHLSAFDDGTACESISFIKNSKL